MSIEVHVRTGQAEKMILQANDILIVKSITNYSSGLVRDALNRPVKVSPYSSISIGPFKTSQQFSIEADPNTVDGEPLIYTVDNRDDGGAARVDFGDASALPNVKSFTSSFTLDASYNGMTLFCDATSNVTVTAPANLPKGFNVRFVLYSTGSVTIAAGAGAINKENKSTLSGLGNDGTLRISIQTPGNNGAQYVLSGGFV